MGRGATGRERWRAGKGQEWERMGKQGGWIKEWGGEGETGGGQWGEDWEDGMERGQLEGGDGEGGNGKGETGGGQRGGGEEGARGGGIYRWI